MRRIAHLGLMLLTVTAAGSLIASDEVLFSNPPVQAGKPGADSQWIRLGGGAGAGLEASDNELFWKTSVQSTILNHFAAGKPVTVGAGEVLVFTFKFKASGLNAAARAFHVGFFNSAKGLIEGGHAGTVIDEKFKGYSGYIVAMNLAGGAQGAYIYRRNPNTGAVDSNNIFGLSTTNVTYMRVGPGYAVQEDEEVEGVLQLENGGSGLKVSFSLNGVAVSGIDPYPIEDIDTVAFVNYGGNAQSIAFTQCEIKLLR